LLRGVHITYFWLLVPLLFWNSPHTIAHIEGSATTGIPNKKRTQEEKKTRLYAVASQGIILKISSFPWTFRHSGRFIILALRVADLRTFLPGHANRHVPLISWQPINRCASLGGFVCRSCCPCIFSCRSDCRSRGMRRVAKHNVHWVSLVPREIGKHNTTKSLLVPTNSHEIHPSTRSGLPE
jgi:hypothetical protein